MNKKLSCILLVDDDPMCHFVHKRVIRNADCAEWVQVAHDGAEAIIYLEKARTGETLWPDLIFLDINMPGVDGWDFLDAYKGLYEVGKVVTAIVVLSSSLNPDDEARALADPNVRSYDTKILTPAALQGHLERLFADNGGR